MKKLLVMTLICSSLLVSCSSGKSNASQTAMIDDSTTFKVLNVNYKFPAINVSDMKILCDTNTGLLYLVGINKGGLSQYNHQIISHDGDVITVQYTLDEFKKEYEGKHNVTIQFDDK